MSNRSVVIVAGGSGSRMGSEVPKQFLLLKGKPILLHTMERFYSYDNHIEIILVLPESQISYWDSIVEKYTIEIPHKVTKGGNSRCESVFNGLKKLSAQIELIAIQDGVRPNSTHDIIKNGFSTALEFGASVAAVKLKDSIRKVSDNGSSQQRNRDDYMLVQTPQCFKREVILDAYQNYFDASNTDDASLVENAGYDVHVYQGSYTNLKITTPDDILAMEKLMN